MNRSSYRKNTLRSMAAPLMEFDGWVPYYGGAPGGRDDDKVRKFSPRHSSPCVTTTLGQVMDKLKALELWEDTLFIVCTDHGFLLGEHQWWGKNIMPVYNEIASTPFFIRDPRCKAEGVRRSALAQTIDIPATLLEYFDASTSAIDDRTSRCVRLWKMIPQYVIMRCLAALAATSISPTASTSICAAHGRKGRGGCMNIP